MWLFFEAIGAGILASFLVALSVLLSGLLFCRAAGIVNSDANVTVLIITAAFGLLALVVLIPLALLWVAGDN